MKKAFWNKTDMGHTTSKDGRFDICKDWVTESYYVLEHGVALHDERFRYRLVFRTLAAAKVYCEHR